LIQYWLWSGCELRWDGQLTEFLSMKAHSCSNYLKTYSLLQLFHNLLRFPPKPQEIVHQMFCFPNYVRNVRKIRRAVKAALCEWANFFFPDLQYFSRASPPRSGGTQKFNERWFDLPPLNQCILFATD